jgi:hypothetical protein
LCKKLGQLPSAVLAEDAGILQLLEMERIMVEGQEVNAGG